jgi:hypothetical protein
MGGLLMTVHYDGQEETNATLSDRRQTHVLQELERQPDLIESIQQIVNELDKRLVGVLRDEDMPPEKASLDIPHQLLVPLAEQLHSHNDRLEFTRRRLRSILDRLEL